MASASASASRCPSHRHRRRLGGHCARFLRSAALAPVFGAASTLFFQLPPAWLLAYLGFFSGFLLYLGAADILPEAHSAKRTGASVSLIALTGAGAALMYVVAQLAR